MAQWTFFVPFLWILARIIHPVEFGALSFKHLASSEHT